MKLWMILFIFAMPFLCAEKKIALVHNFTQHVEDQKIFDLPPNWHAAELPLFYRLKHLPGLQIHATDLKKAAASEQELQKIVENTDWFIFWNLPVHLKRAKLQAIPQKKMILFMWEPPTVEPNLYQLKTHRLFSKIYTWNDDLVDNQKFFKFYYPVLNPLVDERPSFQEKKLCTTIIGRRKSKHPDELYSEREKAIAYFDSLENEDFEFYGYGWENSGFRKYKGAVEDKIDTLKHYKFALCYENIGRLKGYITEKIFDCFSAGCIPIYLGAANVLDYIPEQCFIDRRKFKNEEALYAYLKGMSEAEYAQRIESIENFLKSEAAQKFSRENFLKTFQTAAELKN